MGSEMTQSNAALSSNLEVTKRKRKKEKKKQNTNCSSLKNNDMDDDFPKCSSINLSSIKTDSEIMQHDTQAILYQNSDCREKPNESHNALASNNTDDHPGEGNQCLVEGADTNSISTSKHDDHALVDSNSCNVDDIRTIEGKKQGGTYRRKKIKTKPTEKVSGSIEGFPSSVTSVLDGSAGDSSLHNSDECLASGCSEKMMPEVVGDITPEKASSECPNNKPAYREQEQKIEMENLEETINRQTVVEDVSHVGLPEKCFEKGNMDNLGVKQNAVLDVESAKEIFLKPTTSNEVCGGDPSVEKLESENLAIQLREKDEMPSSLQLDDIKDDINSAINEKGGLQQRFQLSPKGTAPTNLGKKLLVLDVNGLLADIVPYVSEGYTPDTIISRKAVFKRPFCDDFLQFCFEKFHVGVWSSRTKRNVESVLDFLMGKSKQNLLFCWDQSHCTDTGFNTVENRDKPLLLKELKKLWEKHESNLPWERGEYNESNTLLLDDSPYKALKNPRHTAIFPLSYQYKDVNDNSLGPNGDLRVYLEGLALADNVQKYVELNPFGQRPITETNLSWGFYLKVIRTTSSIKQEDNTECSGCHKDFRNDRANYYRN